MIELDVYVLEGLEEAVLESLAILGLKVVEVWVAKVKS